ncbi:MULTISPECIES: methylmalonyl-CoA mutase [unclassified Bradyrhizobium]|uniref:acyl-CoA mutase large subunit family protein n=1 Tax=unclassified Bradyrhizobium TaxID=2631580 RepID=UPI001BAD0470|nr:MULTISPECIES: acyl-CoA mutase large subunit family protein [unclassified Bradyrhizobium]MBR1203002.1 acyl-CoA mutase large subunit family protein [Bradyrhizobium sp. AUGA SZCCT0124]MBR1314417.1 acyl-CoA mutase large subunit family protein [Bradyrhizobium sp. AUGA SZCCT0051]MBR1342565.1 acyl-CoA mutase large subunit family protein [Bradyrhizobium sp. AUGA SZCCT0105]MBR1352795.1 acyl-CoA mutase large subunit family protein [Bradyrhizobium sp. AUGA SZCCT0045]
MTRTAIQLPLPGFEHAQGEWRAQYSRQIGDEKAIRNRSGIEIQPLYSPRDWTGERYLEDVGFPGQFPFTRGIYPTMHRGRTWTQRQLIGLGTPEDYNKRVRRIIGAGATAISLLPCCSGFRGVDCDEVEPVLLGTCGTVINTTDHMDNALDGVPIGEISTAMNDPSPFTLLAFTLGVARRRGVDWRSVTGTSNQSDYISHFIANHQFYRLSLPGSRRVLLDHIEFCRRHVPNWNPVSVVGQHMQQAGSTPAETMGFTLSTAIQYADDCKARGMDIDDVLRRFTFFFDISISLFEEVAKFRAGRRIWARIARDRLGAKDPACWRFKFHGQTSGVDLTQQQPLNNIARVSIQAIAGILSGLQSLHTDAYDEAIACPSEETARVAVATQNILRDEARLCDVIDPLGGSYYVERLTDQMEAEIEGVIAKIDAAGGMYKAAEAGLVQTMIGESALAFQEQVDAGARRIVGVNCYQIDEDSTVPPAERPDPGAMLRHVERFKAFKQERSQRDVASALDALARAANSSDENVFEKVVEATGAGVTHGEVVSCLRRELGFGHPLIVA